MTRFSITMQESIDLVMYALEKGLGGEVIVPIAPSYKILNVAEAVAPDCTHNIVGIRKGEKTHEIMLSSFESFDAVKRDDYYIICSTDGKWNRENYCKKTGSNPVDNGFEYDSGNNDHWLNINQIQKLIETEVK